MSVEPLTEDQLNLIGHETERAVRKSLRKHRRGSVAAYVSVVLALGFVVWDAQHASNESRVKAVTISCGYDARLSKALRTALDGQILFVKRAHEPPPPTVEARVAAIESLKDQIPPPDCKKRIKVAGG